MEQRPRYPFATSYIIAFCLIFNIPGMYLGETLLPFIAYTVSAIALAVVYRLNQKLVAIWDEIDSL